MEEDEKKRKAEYDAMTPNQKKTLAMFDESISRIYKEHDAKTKRKSDSRKKNQSL